ncbi:MAG: hypothetical protein ACJA1A_003187 [Saprospiraceae bacterium]|jgi:hypothetical protein
MKRLLVLVCFIYIGIGQITSQIINVESKRIATDTLGFSGTMGMSMSASRFTQSYVAAELSSQVQWKTNKNLYLLLGDFQIVNAGGESFNNSGFGHFRFNSKFSTKTSLELFTQLQYNSVTKITARFLNGAGLRFKLSPYETAKVYWGVAAMYEYEELSDPQIINKDIRLSTYLSFTLAPVKTITLRNTTYAQPLTGDFNDYRLLNNTTLRFGITKNLSFSTDFSFLYDSRPPIDVPNINYQVKNGLNYRFD